MEICSLWTNEEHFDVDDVLALPMFATNLHTLATEHEWCCPENSRALYRLVYSLTLLSLCSRTFSLLRDGTCTVAIITRPPEIVALFDIPSGDPELSSIPILSDSHPRPHLHPRGATFICFLNEEGSVEYLSSLFQKDKALVESKPWDASLLGQYTAHVLKLKMSTPAAHELAFYQANIRVLVEHSSLREAKEVLSAEVASLKRQVERQVDRAMAAETASREELRILRREIERLKKAATHEESRGSWVEVVSRKGGSPQRKPSISVTLDYL